MSGPSKGHPYWLLHDPGKTHGFATVEYLPNDTPADALARWRASDDGREWLRLLGEWEMRARLVVFLNGEVRDIVDAEHRIVS